ncbi:MAG: NAD(P)H-dependent oxidoreductase [Tetragenococcus halophilus]|uniref:NADPH-dependent FMN reductase-like domain-containing protein n=1 Tax=Tetragenococcus halophilus TaxID=51669 RepID=A0A3G5FI15_TETHA|nr:NAD(P)H-dependent oxidoreductase [Tetragenococcus halophilus]MDN6385314.1 NAD(P)H-dependent oxidoreductase [Alkalibacterium sp.]MDN6497340.1 NAD(P)H-dependent oxidoreductase [Tetragenococcus koreensis]AYW49921.1 hypothetical protein C7H83_05270 [Tetragenococcus halophilus]MDN6112950.1 NAD(P)H-dependent oxidoreductase [Tetragenococcus halophilus]MDN6141558.1 NAD(P)H-dependent oxidoreductase [Tetragenococcus halophilus]
MKFVNATHRNENDKRVFLNASKNVGGKTSLMAKDFFGNLTYQQVNLADYDIPQVGKGTREYDQVWNQVKNADVLLIGTPIYWSDVSGYLKTFMDHLDVNDDLKGADFYVIAQGMAIDQSEAVNTIYGSLSHFASRFGMHFVGIASNEKEVAQLNEQLQ